MLEKLNSLVNLRNYLYNATQSNFSAPILKEKNKINEVNAVIQKLDMLIIGNALHMNFDGIMAEPEEEVDDSPAKGYQEDDGLKTFKVKGRARKNAVKASEESTDNS